MSDHDTHSADAHLSAYYMVFAALILLVGVTIGASMVPLAHFALPVAMVIATFKAVLIVLVFMHVKDEVPLVQVFAFIGFFWLIFMFVFMFSDYATRDVNHAWAPPVRAASDSVPVEPDISAH